MGLYLWPKFAPLPPPPLFLSPAEKLNALLVCQSVLKWVGQARPGYAPILSPFLFRVGVCILPTVKHIILLKKIIFWILQGSFKKLANSRVNGVLGSLSSAAEPCIESERAPWGSSSSSPSLFFQNALMACLLVQRASESEEERAACPPVVVVCEAVSFLSFSRCLSLLVRRARSLPRGLEKKP